MHPKSTSSRRELNEVFSPCSRFQMGRIIRERGGCLGAPPVDCGNGVREGGEQCDCGWEKICGDLDPCCTPSDAPKGGCALRNGSRCSPKESHCCKEDCTIESDAGALCFRSDTHCLISRCDGRTATCPAPPLPRMVIPCKGTSKTCKGGACNSTVCADHDLKTASAKT
ncbi:disintegrin and metalloproteinase domain-containing protein 10 [Caerostris extrusa]|uniref:Disintegrin and metalloproteinase domain-containing protein 10 n=1 Tax=Caerostris extrusa TaxID=172846 RepID=A0AAV4WPW7_CAEEX|nr:disintegrin and metalloproteinase domain-containing protein 10 [Caerostris extrusa]